MRAKEPTSNREDDTPPGTCDAARSEYKPLLMVDIDGVLSLFGFAGQAPLTGHAGPPAGSFHTIDGIPHFLSHAAAAHLLDLVSSFDLVWASGWEEKAEEYLPRLLDLPAGLPFLRFERDVGGGAGGGAARAHWKLAAIARYAGARPLAWIDDALNDACHTWAAARAARGAPTLLVQTAPELGLTARETELLMAWAESLDVPAQ